MVHEFPRALVIDVYHLERAMSHSLVIFSIGAYHISFVIIRLLTTFPCRIFNRSRDAPPALEQGLGRQTTMLELRCISWMIQTSLDKAIRLLALKHLVTMALLPDFDPTLVVGCFDIFIASISLDNRCMVTVKQGLEELAASSAICFLRTFHHLSVMDPTSSVLEDVRQRHDKVFPVATDFRGLPFYYAMAKAHGLLDQTWYDHNWGDYRPSTWEHIQASRDIAEVARVAHEQSQYRKVPCWILRFTLHSLSLDPPPPVVADCLSIIAIDLGCACDVSNIGSMNLDERCVHISQMTITLTLNQ